MSSVVARYTREWSPFSAPEAESAGPARLYYEHRRRSSSQGRRNFRRRSEAAVMEAQPSAGTLDLSQICDRTAADVRGSKKEKSYVPGMTTHSVLISNRLSQSTRNLKTPDRRSGSVSTASLQGSRSEMVGPERFYYDTKSYTGTAKRSLGAPPLDKSHAGSSLEGIGEVTEEETKGMLMDRRQVAQGRPDRSVLSVTSSAAVLPMATPDPLERRVLHHSPSMACLPTLPPAVSYPVQCAGGLSSMPPAVRPQLVPNPVVYSPMVPLAPQRPTTVMFALSSPLDIPPGPRMRPLVIDS